MKHFKQITTAFLFAAFFINITPLTQATANITAAPACLNFVYLPLTISANSTGNRSIQRVAQVSENRSSDQPDFNGDGCADLAIGVPQENLDSGGNQGMVHILYGSSIGVTAEHSQVWHREGGFNVDGSFLGDIQGEFRANDHFGENPRTW